MGTQRIIGLAVALALLFGGIVYFKNQRPQKAKLHVCSWSNYFPDNLVEEFTAKTGIEVQLSYFSSNEELFAKLRAGATGFDLIQPSDYMVRQLAELEMLYPMKKEQLTNLSHLDKYYQTLPYDPGFKYSVPFTWGTTGIAVNTEHVRIPSEGVGWKMLLNSPDPKHTSMLDDMREVFAAALVFNGHSPNTHVSQELEAAKTEIARVKDHILMFNSEPKALLLKGEVNIAHIYSTDGIQANIDNPKIEFFIPKEGGVLWTDNFAIPKDAKHPELAHTFINYFLDPDNALKMITENHLATPNRTAKLRLPENVQKNPNLYPEPEVLKKMVFLTDLGETMTVVNRMWTELKS